MNPPTPYPTPREVTYGSVCSGIEAPSAAWHPLGWKPLWFSEIEPFPKAVLAHRYPEVPDLGDMTTLPARILAGEVPDVDVFVGGTPCQSFSVAGLRLGLADPRGQLTRTYVEILDALDTVRLAKGKPPTVALWENVPGVLSDKDNAFGNFLGALCGEDDALLPAGPRWTNAGSVLGPRRALAWRVLDAQYFGVAQRRKRVFIVASARTSSIDPVEVLLVEQGVRWDPPSRGEAGAAAPAAARGGAPGGGAELAGGERGGRGGRGVASSHWDGDYPHPTLNQAFNTGGIGQSNQELLSQRGSGLVPVEVALLASYPSVVGTLSDGAHNGGGLNGQDAYTGRILPVMAHGQANAEIYEDGSTPTLTCLHEAPIAVTAPLPFDTTQLTHPANRSNPKPGDPCHPLSATAHVPAIVTASREIFTGDGIVADPIGANEANTYTNEESNNFRLHNCVGEPRTERAYVAQAIGNFVPASVAGTLVKHNGAGSGETQNAAYVLQTFASAGQFGAFSRVDVADTLRAKGGDVGMGSETLASQTVATKHSPPAQNWDGQPTSQTLTGRLYGGLGAQQMPDKGNMGAVLQPEGLHMAVRRLTPVECERLQGFPDDFTRIPWKKKPASECPDGPRYKALGNSMAVPVIRWIGQSLGRYL